MGACYVCQSMADIKTISGRELRREAVEENLRPGESVQIVKKSGKAFELRRVDKGPKSLQAAVDQLLVEMPPEGPRTKTNLAKTLIEDRE